ncbi:undecaprenyl-diphosphatase [hydrocarbon metagenome]|uniref:Undecaprenyl-diphosphatase n=1 Tax=hydrocarbon metagenome TaxID=938273 RepID=A0A0W8E5X5_9ZZZZ
MTTLHALILGIVQGLTEFLPVSSSGHLVIFQHILGIQQAPLTFDVIVHLGTLVAVFIAFWQDIVDIARKPFSRITYLILVGIIPAGLAGYLLAPMVEKAFESLLVVGIGLIFTGLVLKYSETVANKYLGLKLIEGTSYKDALFIGIIQALAIIPGISRSGSTIAAGLMAGLDREFAARFSFLLSIPVIFGAGIFQLKDAFEYGFMTPDLVQYLVGFITSAAFGLLAIKVVVKLVRDGRLSIFTYYCWAVAAMTLLAYFIL